jgi:hypothetical protein
MLREAASIFGLREDAPPAPDMSEDGVRTYRSVSLTPNAASLYAAGPGRLTVGFELIMAG